MIDLTLSLYLSDFLSSFYASMQIEPPAFPRIFSEAFDSKEDESMCSEVPVGNATNTSSGSGFFLLSRSRLSYIPRYIFTKRARRIDLPSRLLAIRHYVGQMFDEVRFV